MSIAHRLEDEEMSDVSLCDLLVAMGERSTARLLDKSMPFRQRASEACGEPISHANDPDHPAPIRGECRMGWNQVFKKEKRKIQLLRLRLRPSTSFLTPGWAG